VAGCAFWPLRRRIRDQRLPELSPHHRPAVTIDRKACQAKLAAAERDLTDERQKTTSLTPERDNAKSAFANLAVS
jgi:hypothetical protein